MSFRFNWDFRPLGIDVADITGIDLAGVTAVGTCSVSLLSPSTLKIVGLLGD